MFINHDLTAIKQGNMMIKYYCTYFVNVIFNHKAYESSYLIFLIPLALIIGKILSYHEGDEK